MKMFKKKKKKEPELGLEEEELLEFSEFEEFEPEEKGIKPEEFEKNFIFHIARGCPVCGGDVKGNDYYKYFCDNCNVLFDKKDIIDREFGRYIGEAGPVKKTKLTDDERAELEKKRKELKDRVFKTFSEEEKKALVEEEERKEEEEPEEVEGEIFPPPEEEAEEPEEVEEPEAEEEPEEVEEPEAPRREEYELESADKIIASKESTKMHAGNCHFVKKIHPENRIYLNSVEEGEEQGYDMCVCLRRLRAMQR